MVTELIPTIDREFRTLADRDHRAMAGLSMGGAESLQIVSTHMDLFGSMGLFHPGGTGPFDPKTSFGGTWANTEDVNKKMHTIFIAAGTLDNLYNQNKGIHTSMDTAGIKNTWFESEEAHEWQGWRKDLHEFAPLLFADKK